MGNENFEEESINTSAFLAYANNNMYICF